MKKLILAAAVLGLAAMTASSAKAGDREFASLGTTLVLSLPHVSVSVSGPTFGAQAYCAPAPRVVCAPPRAVCYDRAPVYCGPRVAYRDNDYRDHRDYRDYRRDDRRDDRRDYRNDRRDDRRGDHDGYRR